MPIIARRWDGSKFVSGATMRRWNGTKFLPDPNALSASGGTVFNIGGYKIHVFYGTGTFQVLTGVGNVEAFVVAGGGAGSSGTAGGGGGGGVLQQASIPVAVGNYPIVVGAGGASSGTVMSGGSPGLNSAAFGIVAHGGGVGAYSTSGSPAVVDGTDGGNGGGACGYASQIGAPGHGIVGEGYDGSTAGTMGAGGGFGGAGAGGTNPTTVRDGGPGIVNNWLGSAVYYAGGGGGAGNSDPGNGGLGGGGNGAAASATVGTINTGGGGGGGWYYANGLGASGGSGIVLIRYVENNPMAVAPRSNFGGRLLPQFAGTSGLDPNLKAAPFQNGTFLVQPFEGSSLSVIGGSVESVGVVSHPAPSLNSFGSPTNFACSATVNSTAGTGHIFAPYNLTPSIAAGGGFHFTARLYWPDADYGSGATGSRLFVGATSNSMAASVGSDDPAGSRLGFALSTNLGDVSFKFTSKGDVVEDRTETGMPFVVNHLYDFNMFVPPTCDYCSWQVNDWSAGTLVTGMQTAGLPVADALMRVGFQLATLTTVVRNVRMLKVYAETN